MYVWGQGVGRYVRVSEEKFLLSSLDNGVDDDVITW